MADIFDYLIWRGDISFDSVPLNDIDALILSRVSYIPFDGIVGNTAQNPVPLAEAAAKFLEQPNAKDKVYMDADIRLCEALISAPRFAALPVSHYVNTIDAETELQFSASIFSISDELHFISFRGTDNSIVGWKEDFNMTFMTPVPAQITAAQYLGEVAKSLRGTLYLGGHSKGGNLAAYAAAYASPAVQSRIVAVFSHDSPGFARSVLQSDGYLAVSDKIHTFVPQSSIVGMLLEHEEDYTIVKSRQLSFMQHDLYSWEVLGADFVCLSRVTNSSRFIDQTLKDWFGGLSMKERGEFVDNIFSLFKETNADTFKELADAPLASAKAILRSLSGMDDAARQQVLYSLGLLARSVRENLSGVMPKPPAAPNKLFQKHASPPRLTEAKDSKSEPQE